MVRVRAFFVIVLIAVISSAAAAEDVPLPRPRPGPDFVPFAKIARPYFDPAELTRQRFRQYGEFAFPVLADPKNAVAQKFGVFHPATPTEREDLLHATFVIGRDGRVCWAYCGNDPFTGNATLLSELARSEGRLQK